MIQRGHRFAVPVLSTGWRGNVPADCGSRDPTEGVIVGGTVFLLGAGFNCSVLDSSQELEAPLSHNFFQVLIRSGRLSDRLDGIRTRLFVDLLLAEIERYWGLDLDVLATVPFDIEECLTLFESQMADGPPQEREIALRRSAFALRNLLLMYLGELGHCGHSPAARQFGVDVLALNADVITFNYDCLAEEAIASASGIGQKPQPPRRTAPAGHDTLTDEDLDASHLVWKRSLASGFRFDEVYLPVAGVSQHVPGIRYYAHPANALYDSRRVFKLHGSIDWLTYTPTRMYPHYPDDEEPAEPPGGIVLESHPNFWMGESPTRSGWLMEPIVVPPQLFKQFNAEPFPVLWDQALQSLSWCKRLVVIGYSFPPTDFRTRRLFLEAFSSNSLEELIVVNPDASVVDVVRRLTRFTGPVTTCASLPSLYGLPTSWFPPRDLFRQGVRETRPAP